MRITAVVLAAALAVAAILVSGHPEWVRAQGSANTGELSSPQVLVGLFKASSATLQLSGEFILRSPEGEETRVGQGSLLAFSATQGKIAWEVFPGSRLGDSRKGDSRGPVILSAGNPGYPGEFTVIKQSSASFPLEGRSFTGSAVVMLEDNALLMANLVDLETYVAAVVSSEMPGGWPQEALKAQAVVSRTYALYKTGITPDRLQSSECLTGLGGLLPGNVRLYAQDQIYRGTGSLDPGALEATEATRGQILTWEGKPAATYFHADAAGRTEDVRYVWGGSAPYLKSVQEVPHESPYSSWEVKMDETAVRESLLGFGLSGEVEIEMIRGTGPGISGRWSSVIIKHPLGETQVKGGDFRVALGLRSLLFSSFVAGGMEETRGFLNPGLPLTCASSRGIYTVDPAKLTVVGGTGEKTLIVGGSFVVGAPQPGPRTYVFSGRGWGHGVGLSQWGARAMAESGEDFAAILSHYYPGTKLERWW
ncbi:MAG TPA: SpoIID/LytB domain-containing protein [Firmicutes bacterium]|nr:SpoIID/LytB domain-containing protein [Candidatus Fermentithermobacillaceae bacterium]